MWNADFLLWSSSRDGVGERTRIIQSYSRRGDRESRQEFRGQAFDLHRISHYLAGVYQIGDV